MRTENDLRSAFALLDRAADEPIGSGPLSLAHEVPRRRWVAPATVAASVVLIAATAGVVVALSDRTAHHASGQRAVASASVRVPSSSAAPARPTSAAPRPTARSAAPNAVALHTMPWRKLAFSVTAPGLTTAGALFDTDEQTLDLVGPSGSYVVRVYTDQAGPAYDQNGAVPVEVGGHQGYYAQLTADTDGGQRGVAWQYAPGAWASVARIDATITSAQGVALAETVHVGTATIARTPVAFAPVAGLRTSLWLTGYGNDPHRAGQHGYAAWNALYDFVLDGAQVTVTADDIPGGLVTTGEATTVRGHSAHVVYDSSDHLVSIDWNGHTVNVQENVDGSTGTFRLSRQQILDVARAVTLVDHPADTTTWHDTATALPR